MRAVNAKIWPVIKSEEAGSAAEAGMGTAGTFGPGKDSAEVSTSVVKKCLCFWEETLSKKRLWHCSLLETLSARRCRWRETKRTCL